MSSGSARMSHRNRPQLEAELISIMSWHHVDISASAFRGSWGAKKDTSGIRRVPVHLCQAMLASKGALTLRIASCSVDPIVLWQWPSNSNASLRTARLSRCLSFLPVHPLFEATDSVKAAFIYGVAGAFPDTSVATVCKWHGNKSEFDAALTRDDAFVQELQTKTQWNIAKVCFLPWYCCLGNSCSQTL